MPGVFRLSQTFPYDDPWVALSAWMEAATHSEPRVPDAMQLATVGDDGTPSIRTVLLKAHGPEIGLVFYTNLGSRKAHELSARPVAAVCLHWKTLERQVIAHGPVEPVEAETADAYWATRDRGSQVGAWASRQSHPLADRSELERAARAMEARFASGTVPRPEDWSGFRLHPHQLEFWQGRPDRLHDRHLFTRDDAGWRYGQLYP